MNKKSFKILSLVFIFLMMGTLYCVEPQEPQVVEDNSMVELSPGVFVVVDNSKKADKSALLKKTYSGPYKLQAGDEFEISVAGHKTYTKRLMIGHDGNVTYLLIGQVKAAGLTIPQLQKKLTKIISKYINQPTVTIIPVSFGSRRFTILGSINHPGVYSIPGEMTLLDAIATAGGLKEGHFNNSTMEIADLSHAFLLRDGSYLPVNFQQLIQEGNLNENAVLQSGDYIYIPSALSQEITILGQVRRPGNYRYREGLSLVQLLTIAGGFNDLADQKNIVVIRDTQPKKSIYKLNLEVILKGDKQDFHQEPGDIVYVPEEVPLPFADIVQMAMEIFVRRAASSEASNLAEQ